MLKCKRCKKQFKYMSDFNRHKNRKNPCKSNTNASGVFQCPDCHNTFSTKGNLKRHINGYCDIKQNDDESDDNQLSDKLDDIDEDSNNDDHKCQYCEKSFTFKHNLKRHMNSRCKAKVTAEKEQEIVNNNKKLTTILKTIDEIKRELKPTDEIKSRLKLIEKLLK